MITEFQKKVFGVVKKIPKGQTMTYKEVALAIGNPRAVRAVGTALSESPGMPEVPCHRVIRTDGGMGGFAWGVKKKIQLLKSEAALQ